MRITSAEITNFRCHQRLRLDLDALTILLGANGAGKSSILDALGFFFEPKGFQAVDLNSRAAADADVSVRVEFCELTDADREAFHLTPEGNWVTLRRVAAGGTIRLLAPARRAPMFDNIRAITAAVPRRQAYMDLRAAHPELNLAAATSAPTAGAREHEQELAVHQSAHIATLYGGHVAREDQRSRTHQDYVERCVSSAGPEQKHSHNRLLDATRRH